MPQYVGAVYLDVRFDPTAAASSLSRTMGAAGAVGGAAAGDAVTAALGSRLLAFGTQATRIGRQLSFGLSAPLGALGAASEKAFLAYDTQMTKVAALTGVGSQQTQAWSQDVLDLASRYGIAGEDAAQALYLITSSGIKGQAALDTLDTTLKASAVGMGDAATVAGLLTSAINAYGEANLPAARAADILTGAVQESKIPADQLAGSISNLLPFGTQLGVSFDQIAGSMAALSLQGTNAAQAATQLRGIFNGLLDPSAQAAQAFNRLGLSAEDLRNTLATEGIVPTLRKIRDAIVANGGEADTELAQIFGNVRALTGAFGLLNEEGGKVDRVMANTANSAGKLNAAFRVTADSGSFKARQASEALHNELIQLGSDVAPVVTSLLGVARAGLAIFDALGPLRPVLVTIGAGLVVLGPLAYSVGALADVFGLIATAAAAGAGSISAQAGATTALAAAQARLATAAAAAAAAGEAEVVTFTMAGETIVTGSAAGTAAQVELAAATEAVAAAEAQVAVAAGASAGPIAAIAAAAVPIAAAAVAVAGGIALWKIRMDQADASANTLGDTFANKVASGGIAEANTTIGKTQEQIKALSDEVADSHAPWDADYRAELEKGIDALKAHIAATQADMDMAAKLSAQTGENADKAFQWLSNERNAGRTYASSEEALKAYSDAMAKHGGVVTTAATATGKLVDKAKELADKFFGATSAQKAYDDAVTKVADAQRAADDAARAAIDARRDERDAVEKVTEAHQRHRDALAKVAEAQKNLAETQATLNELLKGPTKGEQLDVRSAELALKRAQAALRKPGQDPLDRQQAQIDVERARIGLDDARGAHAKNLAKAQGDVQSAQRGVTDAQREAIAAAKAIDDAQRGVADAHRKVEDADRAAVKAQEAIGQAQLDAAGAADNLAQKQAALATAIANSNQGAGPLVAYLTELKGLYPDAAGGIQIYLDKAAALQAFYDAQKPQPPPPGAYDPEQYGHTERRAMGGSLGVGQLSTVNEMNLPELWSQGGKQYLLPLQAGNVTPLKPVDMPIKGGDGFSVGDINVYEVSGKPRQTAYEVRRELHKASYLGGRRR